MREEFGVSWFRPAPSLSFGPDLPLKRSRLFVSLSAECSRSLGGYMCVFVKGGGQLKGACGVPGGANAPDQLF